MRYFVRNKNYVKIYYTIHLQENIRYFVITRFANIRFICDNYLSNFVTNYKFLTCKTCKNDLEFEKF